MKRFLIALIASIACHGAAHAQIDPTRQAGSMIYSKPEKSDDAARNASYSKSVANCTYNRLGETTVTAFLDSSDPVTVKLNDTSLNWRRVSKAIQGCMETRMDDFSTNVRLSTVGMEFTRNRIRALFLEEAYLAQAREPVKLPDGATELSNRRYISVGKALETAQGLGNYADCLVFRDIAGADRLLRTEPGSDQEREAATALAPVLGACLIDGQTISFTPGSIRALAADGLWARIAYGSVEG